MTSPRFRTLTGGRHGVTVRRARRSDEAGLLALYERVSPESRYRRFHGVPGARIVRLEAHRVTHGGDGTQAWLAVAPDGTVIGCVSMVPGRDGAHEIAVLVDDAWTGRGIAGRLVDEALAQAARAGVGTVVAWVQGDNAAAVHLFRSRPGARARFEDGEIKVDIAVVPAPTAARRLAFALQPAG